MKGGEQGGEIVPVDGRHIIGATGRKDRHSKVYTAKGPRDRRVRLSAHTAIQFYDVQDRLGYDRPSKAVDWLIKKAKAAIDRLNEAAPPWQTSHNGTPTPDSNPSSSDFGLDHQYEVIHPDNHNSSGGTTNSSFMASSGEPDLTNTMKSLFPTNSFGGFSNHACQSSSFQAEDLGLSLQTIHGENERNSHFPFESFQRIDGWNNGSGSGGDHVEGRVGILLNSPQPIFSSFSQREFLQSNLAANQWNQRPLINPTYHHQHDHLQPRSSKSSNLDSPFELGFRVPARIYGEEEGDKHR